MNPSAGTRPYTKPVLRELGSMEHVRKKTVFKGGFKNDSNTHRQTKLKPS